MINLSDFGLDKKVAIVTGAGRGIGKSIALSFANFGTDVVIGEIDAGTGESTANEIRAMGRKSLAIKTDVKDSRQVANLVNGALSEFGRIDILVNNAGIAIPMKPIVTMPEDDWDAIMANNLKSVFLCSRAVARVMIDQKSGNIINIASMSGMRATPGTAPYGTAKAGVISLTRTLAAELARYHIRVNAIAPGPIDTPLGAGVGGTNAERVQRIGVPLGRIGSPDDVAAAAIYLASDASDYLSGEIIEVKGGPVIRKGDIEMFTEKFPNL